MISPKICHCIHPFFREYAPVSTPSSYCIRYSVIKRYSVIVLYKMHIVHCDDDLSQVLGDYLVTSPYEEGETALPSPSQLM